MKEWLRETRGPVFELFRHFLLSFFASELVTATGQTASTLFGVFACLLPCGMMFVQPLKLKYEYLSSLPVPGPYREAVRADELWLIVLVMSAMGVLTAIKWQSLFPGLRDYRALASLPLRPAQVFAGKFLALVAVATVAVFTLSSLTACTFAPVSTSRWAMNPSLGPRILAHTAASSAAGYFFFFAVVTLQGLLLNVMRPRLFERVTGYLQGFLVAAMLILLVMSFSIQPEFTRAAIRPELARWLPPVWFLGLYQAISGDLDPGMQALAHTARAALAISAGLAVFTYLIGYGRHRALVVEGVALPAKTRPWAAALLDWFGPDPRQQAILVFMMRTMAGSGQHRMILMGYGGFGLAILLSGMIGMREMVAPARLVPACFVYAHVILLVFLLLGVRHLFSIPTELGANWMFRIAEREGRRHWMRAVDRLILFSGAVFMLAIPFPAEVKFLAWRALAESALFAVFGLLCYEWAFSSWEKLPFTCSYLPGKTPAWIVALKLLGILTLLPIVSGIMLACLYNPVAYLAAMAILLAAWARACAIRKETWGEVRLRYEELPEPAIHGLNLLQ
jgi:hypothetical protein